MRYITLLLPLSLLVACNNPVKPEDVKPVKAENTPPVQSLVLEMHGEEGQNLVQRRLTINRDLSTHLHKSWVGYDGSHEVSGNGKISQQDFVALERQLEAANYMSLPYKKGYVGGIPPATYSELEAVFPSGNIKRGCHTYPEVAALCDVLQRHAPPLPVDPMAGAYPAGRGNL
ncbi:MAG: hypothetical protein KJ914_01030 [Gammaproteobacteria bacterium]|nr:hypothetical protein [Gammaproteobacteria bacterium]MBU1724226.1 hypothetical protein [Gammaproteobacteria bacterium]MBU2007176.1 hypothetical protein [Gammaproteobacteria bacterium]